MYFSSVRVMGLFCYQRQGHGDVIQRGHLNPAQRATSQTQRIDGRHQQDKAIRDQGLVIQIGISGAGRRQGKLHQPRAKAFRR